MPPQRLPIVNSDDAVWGDIIRQYLMKEHYNDDTNNAANGGHQKITIRAGTATAGTAPLKFTSGTVLGTAEAGAMEFNTDAAYFTITTGPARMRIPLFSETSAAVGDLLYRDSTGNFSKLAAVATGKSLRSAGTGTAPAYGDLAQVAAGSSQVVTKTTSYTINSTNNDVIIFADNTSGPVTITLPVASTVAGYRFYVKRIDGVVANACTIARSGSDTIDGATSQTLDLQYTAIAVVSNGTNWYIL